ncbi:hypothetical protein V1520DRAFT_334353 [Lipomyces starkeyi]|uniref:M-phase phosphoprotein 6 n=1 Tax=Lipomyces starkeyi NRRL Y-11557 TaxID=675824 RepID=A0A1E3Q4C1_LIPST|nr:hypothetical protein LIPSTDRAFT_111700 [Lipomyces starkeyi NRRL Y-11557]
MSRKGTHLNNNNNNKKKKNNEPLTEKVATPSTASAKGLSSKLLTMKFMRQAAAKEKLAELEEQQRQVDDASKWRLPDTEKYANVTPSSKLRVIQGVGFHVIDSSNEDLPALAGRRSWGRFNEKFDQTKKNESPKSSPDGDEEEAEEDEDPEEMKKRRKREQEEEENMILHARMSKSVSGAGAPLRAPKQKSDKNDKKKQFPKDTKKRPSNKKNGGGGGQAKNKKQKKS